MKKFLPAAAALLFAAASGTAAAEELSIDSKKEAVYTCVGNGERFKLNAMYGIKAGKVVVAQLKVDGNISPGLFPVADAKQNRFVSQDAGETTWTTGLSDGGNIDKVHGGVLSVKGRSGRQAVLLEDCKLDKAATAALNRKGK